MRETGRHGRKAIKAEEILNRFIEADLEGLSLDELREYFSETADSERSATSFIAKLNKACLNDQELRIEGENSIPRDQKNQTIRLELANLREKIEINKK